MFLLRKTIEFAASHFLTDYHGKCEHLHGHNYTLTVTLKGKKQSDGMVFDFVELKKLLQEKIYNRVDHKHLNDILQNPSSENMCEWIWEELSLELEGKLYSITLCETARSCVEYFGPHTL